jgi:hypothetical protein
MIEQLSLVTSSQVGDHPDLQGTNQIQHVVMARQLLK